MHEKWGRRWCRLGCKQRHRHLMVSAMQENVIWEHPN